MGGRRRSSNKPPPKRKPKLERIFKCPICSHEGTTATIVNTPALKKAKVSCKVCKEEHEYRKKVTYLTEPIDVFSDWIDALESKSKGSKKSGQRLSTSAKKPRTEEEEEEETFEESKSKKDLIDEEVNDEERLDSEEED